MSEDQTNSLGVPLDQDELGDPSDNSQAPDPLIDEQPRSGAIAIGTRADQQDRVSQSRAGMDSLRNQYATTAGQAADAYAQQKDVLDRATQRLINTNLGPSAKEIAYRQAAALGATDSSGRFNIGNYNASQAEILQEQRQAEQKKNDLLTQYGLQVPQSTIAGANARLNQITQQQRIQQSDINNASGKVDQTVNAAPKVLPGGMVYNRDTGEYENHPEIVAAQNAQKQQQAAAAAALKVATQKAIGGGQLTDDELNFMADKYNLDPHSIGPGLSRSGAMIPIIARAADRAKANGDDASSILASGQLQRAQMGVLTDFTKGNTAKQLDRLNTSIQHADILQPMIAQLGNTASPAYNYAANIVKTQMGSSAPTTFNTVRDFLAGEVSGAVLPGGGGEAERNAISSAMKNASGPDVLNEQLSKWKELLAGKTNVTRNRWDQWTGGRFGDFNTKFLLPNTQRALGITAHQPSRPGQTQYTPEQIAAAKKYGVTL